MRWASACLNCNPNNVQVELLRPTRSLGWPDFLDDPGFGPEHPDYAGAIAVLADVNRWLTLDREQLINELLSQRNEMSVRESRQRQLDAKTAGFDLLMKTLAEQGLTNPAAIGTPNLGAIASMCATLKAQTTG